MNILPSELIKEYQIFKRIKWNHSNSRVLFEFYFSPLIENRSYLEELYERNCNPVNAITVEDVVNQGEATNAEALKPSD